MGLISKIEDKLSSDKGKQDSSTLQNEQYGNESSNSHLRHPVSSGTGSQGYSSSTTGATTGSGLTGGGSGLSGSHGDPRTTDVGRDGYGHSSSGYGSSTTRDPRDYGSSTTRDPRDNTTSGGMTGGSREPFDPYSSKGQSTAANAASGYPGGSTHGSSTYANDPNVPRTREGGVMNSSSDPLSRDDPYSSSSTARGYQEPHSTGMTSGSRDPYTTSTQNSSGHPIRDAALAGGAGAAGAGYGQHASSHNPQDPSYMSRSGGRDEMRSTGMGSTGTGSTGIGSTGMGSTGMGSTGMGSTGVMGGGSTIPTNDPKQQAASYEAGYRDGMEHAKQQVGR